MRLYLLRHGLAAERDPARFPDDALRPLTARGREQMGMIAAAMRRLDLGIDAIWTSPLVRARETAATVADGLGLEGVQVVQQLAPDDDLRGLLCGLAALAPGADNVLLVGHEPDLSGLLSLVTSGGSTVRTRLKKASLAKLDVTGPLHAGQCATLQWLLPPKTLVMLSGVDPPSLR